MTTPKAHMPNRDLSPIAVVPYSKNYIIGFVRHQTGWDHRSEVSDKIQLNYLCNYLSEEHIGAKTIVVEQEYIDRHYLEDYSEYYARCFPSHPRKCSRLHFFSHTFSEHEFTSALETNNKDFFNALSAGYIGFVVIRPIPHTFLAKLCVKRYEDLINNKNCKLIAKKISISLFGVPLLVESAPFLEQDKVVSACATSALWMFFNSSSQELNGSLPSPSAITKSATGSAYDGLRTFPTTGLSPIQVSRSLKSFGFEPLIVKIGSSLNELKEVLYGYISNGIPVLVAGSIYQKNKKEAIQHAGKHLVCALGYRLGDNKSSNADEMQLVSHGIEKIYVHDDRYGPYVRVSMDPVDFICDKKKKTGLEFSLHGVTKKDYFVPDMLIIGLYHKVRLSYFDIRSMCDALYLYLQQSNSRFDILRKKKYDDSGQKLYFKNNFESINLFLRGQYEISLTTNTDIKDQLRASDTFATFNGAVTKTSCLLQSMPKYIWRCRVFLQVAGEASKELFTDILFDATEVAQGQVIVGYISYTNNAERVWKHVESAICNNTWDSYKVDDEAKKNVSGFLKFFSKNKNRTNLNTLYGPLGYPRRDLKLGEMDDHRNISQRNDTQIIRAGNTAFWASLPKEKTHIWVINEMGDLVLGEDVAVNGEFQGHPTLVDEKPARLGGELHFCAKRNCWLVNLRSRTYSSHIETGSDLWRSYLEQVIQNNLKGQKVEIEE